MTLALLEPTIVLSPLEVGMEVSAVLDVFVDSVVRGKSKSNSNDGVEGADTTTLPSANVLAMGLRE